MNRTAAYYDLARDHGLGFSEARTLLDQAETRGSAPLPGGVTLTHTAETGFGVLEPGGNEHEPEAGA